MQSRNNLHILNRRLFSYSSSSVLWYQCTIVITSVVDYYIICLSIPYTAHETYVKSRSCCELSTGDLYRCHIIMYNHHPQPFIASCHLLSHALPHPQLRFMLMLGEALQQKHQQNSPHAVAPGWLVETNYTTRGSPWPPPQNDEETHPHILRQGGSGSVTFSSPPPLEYALEEDGSVALREFLWDGINAII